MKVFSSPASLLSAALLAAALAFPACAQERRAAEASAPPPKAQAQAQADPKPSKHLLEGTLPAASTPREPKITPREAGNIARATGTLLTVAHYRQTPLADDLSRTFFTNYLATLDYGRLVFTQQDVDEFAQKYADRLDDLTQLGDATPAYEIFRRYLQRLEERNQHLRDRLTPL